MKRAIIIALILSTVSCRHKELCYNHPHGALLDIYYDWGELEEIPEGMRVYFYDIEDTTRYYRFDISPEGERISIPAGHYHSVTFNNDTETHQVRGEGSINTLELYTRETTVADPEQRIPSKSDPERVVLTPEALHRDRLDSLEVLDSSVSTSQSITYTPQQIIKHITYEISQINNSQAITQIRGSLSGVAGSHYVGTNTHSAESTTVPFNGAIDSLESSKITGAFTIYGHCPNKTNKHTFTIYLWSRGGNIMSSYDVTDQIHSAPNPDSIHLVIRTTINMPESIGGGITPTVDEWEETKEEIII